MSVNAPLASPDRGFLPPLRWMWRVLSDPGALPSAGPRWPRGVALDLALGGAQAALALWARFVVAWAFGSSGLTKVRDWETTLALFENEYAVPVLSPGLAAWLGTGGELVLPVMLLLGWGGRLAALGLSVVNAVAVISLPEVAPAAWVQHQLWGALLLALAFWGPGGLSMDAWRTRRLTRSGECR